MLKSKVFGLDSKIDSMIDGGYDCLVAKCSVWFSKVDFQSEKLAETRHC